MNIYLRIHKAPIRVFRIGRRRFWLRVKLDMLVVKEALSQEKQETKEMLVTYKRYTRKQANKDELADANKQFADLLKGLGLGVFAVLPFAPLTIPLVLKLGKMVGVDVLPSSFNNMSERKANARQLSRSNSRKNRIKASNAGQ
ncbi:hypothetical protein [Shewanella sp. 10N.286.54.B9]|uniref:hypothetical protein n=1 Tax=Shewanella sp. 10N.286.54.B9 TaxID=3229719 RepID=UPI00354DDAC8